MKADAYTKKISLLRNIVAEKFLLNITQNVFIKNLVHSFTRFLIPSFHFRFVCISIYHNIWYLAKNNLEKQSLYHQVRRW